jgi:large subunit ribosomal protein L10
MPTPKKAEIVEEIAKKFEKSKAVVLNDFTGLDVEKMTELRRLCREAGVDYVVYKNTLAIRGIKNSAAEALTETLEGPTAFAFGEEDEVTAAKVLAEFAKEHERPVFKGGYVAGRVLSKEEIEALAKLPGREELLAQMMGVIQGPARGIATALSQVMRSLATVIDQAKDRLENE